jgi:8-oxo-dGTP pyrophosphatase MutT (NUDIX family)
MYKVFVKEVAIIVASDKDAFPDYDVFSLKKVDLQKIIRKIRKGKLERVLLHCKSNKKLLKHLHKKLPLVIAAGGLVINNKQEYLFIHRNGKWDLPKGKMDKNETVADTAVRETMEETGVQDLIINKYLGATYHIFDWRENSKIKLTHWYVMSTNHTGSLVPQENEGIEQATWLSKEDAVNALKVSYENIKYLFPADMLI